MFKHVAVDDQIGFTSSRIVDCFYTRSGINSGNVIYVGLCSFDQSNDEVAMIASMIEHSSDLLISKVLAENGRQHRATGLVTFCGR